MWANGNDMFVLVLLMMNGVLITMTFSQKFPLIRAINWFEYVKEEYGENRDFTLTDNPKVREAFAADIAALPSGTFQFGSNLVQAKL